ncbi:MAG: hypothetical protein L0219_07355 [Phycisphaerales bacterium]|nr:hypothetical protein [Phycisphaerales bacterium]
MTTSSFARLATKTCSIKRLQPVIDKKRGEATPILVGLRCTPLDPLDGEIRETLTLTKPYKARMTFIEGDHQLVETDVLVMDGTEYAIRASEPMDWPLGGGVRTTRVIVEETRVQA